MTENRVVVKRAINPVKGTTRRNWLVYDYRGPKVFIRVFTFSYFDAAIKNADRLARHDLIRPNALFGCHRQEYTND